MREECGWASDDAAWYRHGFAHGAVWVAGRLPDRDELAAAVLYADTCLPDAPNVADQVADIVDAVLALIQERLTAGAE